jgi:hypothetical protein
MVKLVPTLDPLEEALYIFLRKCSVSGFSGKLIGEPELAGPKAVCPLVVSHHPIQAVCGCWGWELSITINRHVRIDLRQGSIEAKLELILTKGLCRVPAFGVCKWLNEWDTHAPSSQSK